MKKCFNATKYADIKPWVISAIAAEDEKPSDQMWKNEPSADHIQKERLRRVLFLKKHAKSDPKAIIVADRLEACEARNRCLSGACPECGRLFQRWFVRESKTFIRDELVHPERRLFALSIVPPQSVVRPRHLCRFSIDDFQRRLKYVLEKAELGLALGGLDFSFNEVEEGHYKPFWCPHIYVITATSNQCRLKTRLRKCFETTRAISKPIMIKSFANNARRRSYALKMHFYKRIGYKEESIREGRFERCRNARSDKLRAKERLELFIYLDQIGLAARVVFRGAKPTINLSGVRIKKV